MNATASNNLYPASQALTQRPILAARRDLLDLGKAERELDEKRGAS